MQDALFPEAPSAAKTAIKPANKIQAQPAAESVRALAAQLPPTLRLGTSSWAYPGWAGQVWQRAYPASALSRQGLGAYAQHPLLRAVGIDRSFYQPLQASQYERYAAQVPADFRFTVKAPSLVTDALLRDEQGWGGRSNSAFLDPALALQEFVRPAVEGLGDKIGALVFQLSPLSPALLARRGEVLDRLHGLLSALPRLDGPACMAIEVRDPELLCEDLVALLRDTGVRYCLGLHAKLPALQEQLWILRRLWPAPLICRWNLHRRFDPFGYQEALRRYGDFDAMQDPDLPTRALLAHVIRGTAAAGLPCQVTISNEAEGSAPASVLALAQEILNVADATVPKA
jgi:uncharacterized protein YecE (DUF72 family)